MKKLLFFSVLLFLTILLSILVINAFGQSLDYLSILIKPEQQKEYGIHKLSETEKSKLNQLIEILIKTKSNDLGESAIAYLKNDGWQEIEVIGIRRLKLENQSDAKEYLIVYKSPWTYILEPQTYANLSPGKYLGKMGYTSCEIIDIDGDVIRFWTEDTK